jgi:hypothetical protein
MVPMATNPPGFRNELTLQNTPSNATVVLDLQATPTSREVVFQQYVKRIASRLVSPGLGSYLRATGQPVLLLTSIDFSEPPPLPSYGHASQWREYDDSENAQ